MYIAGVGNDPRQDRVFNTKRQADMYDPNGEYQKLWLHENMAKNDS
jgi:deoxyribodipyrimidine photo-lyase